ncbi:MAG TPA: GNAT family N-acetyltransferase [Candidatus Cybelea sp.]|jgi:GNAT superfamily N-acetyltransferase
MTRDVNVPVRIRPARAADVPRIATIHVAAWHVAYRGLIPDDQIAARTLELRIGHWTAGLERSDLLIFVACDDNEGVQGFASVTRIEDEAFQSYLETLYVMPDAWGRGIGRELLSAIGARLLDAGVTNMALRTLRLGEARGFYERLGARLVPEGIRHGAERFDELVYAFDDLAVLTAEPQR